MLFLILLFFFNKMFEGMGVRQYVAFTFIELKIFTQTIGTPTHPIGPRNKGKGFRFGEYSKTKISCYVVLYTWEKSKTLTNYVAALSILPDSWISDDFKYAVVPNGDFYFVYQNPTNETFEGFEVPQTSWGEYDICKFARRNQCK